MRRLRRFQNEVGATLVEYALLVSLVLVVSLGALQSLEDNGGERLDGRAELAGNPGEVNGNLSPPTTSGSTPVPDPDPDPDPDPTPAVVHLTSLTAVTNQDGSNWVATVTVVVSDADGQPVEGVSCSGTWSPSTGTTETSDVSDDQGRCVMTQGAMRRSGTGAINSVTFDLVSLSGAGVESYDSSANADATTEVINKP